MGGGKRRISQLFHSSKCGYGRFPGDRKTICFTKSEDGMWAGSAGQKLIVWIWDGGGRWGWGKEGKPVASARLDVGMAASSGTGKLSALSGPRVERGRGVKANSFNSS